MLRPFFLRCREVTAEHQPKMSSAPLAIIGIIFSGLLYEIIMQMKEQAHDPLRGWFSLVLFIYLISGMEGFHSTNNIMHT